MDAISMPFADISDSTFFNNVFFMNPIGAPSEHTHNQHAMLTHDAILREEFDINLLEQVLEPSFFMNNGAPAVPQKRTSFQLPDAPTGQYFVQLQAPVKDICGSDNHDEASSVSSSPEQTSAHSPSHSISSGCSSSPPSPVPRSAKEPASSSGSGGQSKPRSRSRTKKQPAPADFATHEEYLAEWNHWRMLRDSNNISVKRSRAAKKGLKSKSRRGGSKNAKRRAHYASSEVSWD